VHTRNEGSKSCSITRTWITRNKERLNRCGKRIVVFERSLSPVAGKIHPAVRNRYVEGRHGATRARMWIRNQLPTAATPQSRRTLLGGAVQKRGVEERGSLVELLTLRVLDSMRATVLRMIRSMHFPCGLDVMHHHDTVDGTAHAQECRFR